MDRRLYVFPAFTWLVGIAMVKWLDYSPLLYGIQCLVGVTLFGLYLRRLGKELR